MGNISSINFKKSNAINTQHNDRTLPPSYLQIKEGGFEVNRSFEEAQALKEKIISEAIQKYTELTNQKFQGKSFEWSAVVNLKEDSTMQDLESLASYFQEKYGFQCYQIAIHRDEGHIDEKGVLKINHHAHLEFIMLDKDTGKTCFKMRDFTKKEMRAIQTKVADILGMERGVDKRISKTKRIEPRAYAKMKEIKQEIKQAKLNRKELIKEYTEQMKGKGFKQTDFQAMRGIANDEELESEDKIREQIKIFLEERAKEIEELNKEPEVITITKEKEVIKEIIPSFEEIKQNLTYEQRKEIAKPYIEISNKNLKEAEAQRDKTYNENLELKMEIRTYYETKGWDNATFNQELAKERLINQNLKQELEEVKKTPQNQNTAPQIVQKITEEQKQEIIAPYKEKIDFLEGVIQKFHSYLVKLGLKKEDSHSHDVPTLPKMSSQTRITLQKAIKTAINKVLSMGGIER